jgi:uncharacterized damage-inducible protein DinB
VSLEEQLVETWSIHDRIHHYMLDAIADEALTATSASKGRTVAEQFAHIHNVRRMWLAAAAPDLAAPIEKLDKGAALDKARLGAALAASATAVSTLLASSLAAGARLKGFKPHTVAFLGYLISHESHHRGQIALTLKQAGYPLDKKTAFGLWEWGVR